MKRSIMVLATVLASVLLLTGCTSTDADVASKNLSKAAEQFEVPRRITFINGITDKYLLTIEGYCSVETGASGLSGSLEVTCRVIGEGGKVGFKKAFLGAGGRPPSLKIRGAPRRLPRLRGFSRAR